ncbi:MAG: tripartite tricarboxylate transporter TctB family protein [Bdellovibrionales bacterium]|nr:tripartite tricarboxylate transporter TctB family protein [Bdellovibrionales bacterium]
MKSLVAHSLLLVLFLSFSLFFITSNSFLGEGDEGLSAGSYPFALGLLLFFFVLLQIWEVMDKREENETGSLSVGYPIIVFVIVGVSLSFVSYLGFYLSSSLIVLSLYLLLEKSRVFQGAIFTVLWFALSYFVFGYLLQVPFPAFGGS